MIDHKKKVIFLHIPKTGGTSVEQVLGRDPIQETFYQHDHLVYYKSDCSNAYRSYYKFTIVRNPWDRVVSSYKFLTNRNLKFPGPRVKKVFTGLTFKKFLDKFFNMVEEDFPGFPTGWFNKTMNRMRIGQLEFLDPIIDVDYIIRFENFQVDFNTICDEIGIPRQQLPHANKSKSKHRHYTEYYDDETKQIVAEKYAKDIKYFGYEFGE
tara:strand:- start:1942 stop:2568 length:627 start_codon:yes stop_codon:yes gene_type:complete